MLFRSLRTVRDFLSQPSGLSSDQPRQYLGRSSSDFEQSVAGDDRGRRRVLDEEDAQNIFFLRKKPGKSCRCLLPHKFLDRLNSKSTFRLLCACHNVDANHEL